MYASDFPHFGHTPAYVETLDELLDLLPPRRPPEDHGGNAKQLYGIGPDVVVGTP